MKRERMRRLALALARRWNRLAAYWRGSPVNDGMVNQRVDSFYDGLSNYTLQPLLLALVLTIFRVVLDVAITRRLFHCFHLCGAIGYLVDRLWSDAGSEQSERLAGRVGHGRISSLAVVYARLGAPGAVAVAAALAYRLIAFWLLRFIGFVTWQVLEARYKPKG